MKKLLFSLLLVFGFQNYANSEKIIDYVGLGHICIIVDNIFEATTYYQKVLEATPLQLFPHFKNIGFAKSAGFLNNPEKVDVTISFLGVANLVIELMEYHEPEGQTKPTVFNTNDVSGVRHIALKVKNIDQVFEYIKKMPYTKFINKSKNYQPFQIDPIQKTDFEFYDETEEANPAAKEEVCNTIEKIRYFYFLDKYGVQWEIEQGHTDIGA